MCENTHTVNEIFIVNLLRRNGYFINAMDIDGLML